MQHFLGTLNYIAQGFTVLHSSNEKQNVILLFIRSLTIYLQCTLLAYFLPICWTEFVERLHFCHLFLSTMSWACASQDLNSPLFLALHCKYIQVYSFLHVSHIRETTSICCHSSVCICNVGTKSAQTQFDFMLDQRYVTPCQQ